MVILLSLVVLVILVLGGVYVFFLRRVARESAGWRIVALTGLVSGSLAAVLTGLAAVLSLTPLLDATSFRGPLGVVAFLGIPAALVGVGCSAFGLKSEAQMASVVGFALSVVSIVTWIAMEATLGG